MTSSRTHRNEVSMGDITATVHVDASNYNEAMTRAKEQIGQIDKAFDNITKDLHLATRWKILRAALHILHEKRHKRSKRQQKRIEAMEAALVLLETSKSAKTLDNQELVDRLWEAFYE